MNKIDKVLQPYQDFKTHCLHRGIPFQISEINLMEKFEVGLLNYFDELQNKTKKYNILEQENFDLRQQLNTEEECCVMLEKKIKEFNKLIKILKEKFFIDIIEREYDYKVGFEPKIPLVNGIATRFTQINSEEAKLLKELLDYE